MNGRHHPCQDFTGRTKAYYQTLPQTEPIVGGISIAVCYVDSTPSGTARGFRQQPPLVQCQDSDVAQGSRKLDVGSLVLPILSCPAAERGTYVSALSVLSEVHRWCTAAGKMLLLWRTWSRADLYCACLFGICLCFRSQRTPECLAMTSTDMMSTCSTRSELRSSPCVPCGSCV